MTTLEFKSFPEPGNKYKVGLKIGSGVGGEVFEAVENQTGKKVAIKVCELNKETEDEIQQEYIVLQKMSSNENFPEFYEVFLKKGKDGTQKIWFVMEFCQRGEAIDLVRKLNQDNKRMNERHIAYIMRETIKAIVHLHENDISHRDIKGSNIVLTTDGRVKLIDFGISKRIETNKKFKTCIGSPSWLAPEVITSQTDEEPMGYDKKADVWALGITAIELGDGQAPFEGMHPGRALFQIVKNPPPTLQKPSDWSQLYNDFISECLVKIPENRPYAQELLIHPFFESLDEEENLLHDLSSLLEQYKDTNLYKKQDVQVRKGRMKTEEKPGTEKILQEDLAAMTKVSEDSVLFELHERLKKKEIHTYVGDILLILNSNKISDEYGVQYHKKYRFKAKSQNAPHIYAIADSSYRDAFHHFKPQHILFAGETGTGKTANIKHAIDHLLFLGQGLGSSEKIPMALNAIHNLGNAATPHNVNSTRHVLQIQLGFTDTGKVSGAVFRLYLLEKKRVTMTAKKQMNFHIFYLFYDAIKSDNKLKQFYMADTDYKFLKIESNSYNEKNYENVAKYQLFENNLKDLGFEEQQLHSIKNILAAILLLGEIEFSDDEDGNGVLSTPETVKNVADLLGVDYKKLSWALLNYCLIINGEAIMRHNVKEEAEEAKNVLATGLYSRLVDWIVNTINEKSSVSRVVYGDRHVISLLDLYGFECYKRNSLNQLFVNTINEQLQFHYNQKIFTWDKQTAEEEEITFSKLEFNDNKIVLDLIMSKPDGFLQKLDEATRNKDSSNILDNFKPAKGSPISAENSQEFFINHYTGKIHYDVSDMIEKNRDFLPPEIIETMRLSEQELTKQLFSTLLSKSGNLSQQNRRQSQDDTVADLRKNKEKAMDATPSGQYSQSRQMRTAATTFRSACIDLFKNLTIKDNGFHFVRCIRTDLSNKPGAFDPEVVRQQLRALNVVNTILTIQQGYAYSVTFEEFIRRYKFLAFDFDENVEETKENCRLLLLRLKLEGWTMGKTRVFLKYYNKEYLSRLYETQIKKIVKVQSMMRAFMARRKLYAKIRRYQVNADKILSITKEENEEELEVRAARIIQRRFRDFSSSKRNLTEDEKEFIKPWCKRWRSKSIFQVLLLCRSEKLQTLVNFCLQAHIYNQEFRNSLLKIKSEVNVENIQKGVNENDFRCVPPFISKTPFMWERLNLKEDVSDCEPLPESNLQKLEEIQKKKLTKSESCRTEEKIIPKNYEDKDVQTEFDLMSANATETPNFSNSAVSNNTENKQIENNQSKSKDNQESQHFAIENERHIEDIKTTDTSESVLITEVENTVKVIPTPRNIELLNKVQTPPVKPRGNSKRNSEPQSNFKISFTELEEKFKNKNYNENGEDPPYNFRALLKKANHSTVPKRASDQSLTEIASTYNFTGDKKTIRRSHSDIIVTEIAPGILVYGKIADL